MDVEAPRGLLRFFDEIQDPRMDRTKLHLLSDMLVITLRATVEEERFEEAARLRDALKDLERLEN